LVAEVWQKQRTGAWRRCGCTRARSGRASAIRDFGPMPALRQAERTIRDGQSNAMLSKKRQFERAFNFSICSKSILFLRNFTKYGE
jgi:hypothetical protein